VRYLLKVAFEHAGLDYRDHVEIDSDLLRPAEVFHLLGDASKAKRELGWEPTITFEELVHMMVDEDLAALQGGSREPAMAHQMQSAPSYAGSLRTTH